MEKARAAHPKSGRAVTSLGDSHPYSAREHRAGASRACFNNAYADGPLAAHGGRPLKGRPASP